jgi:sialic acid synthase SpsE
MSDVSVTPIEIAGRKIGPGEPPFIIAEVGINHEGEMEKAVACVDAAADAGADCVKFQTHITEAEMIPTDMRPGKISEDRLWDIIKRCELAEADEVQLKHHCEERGIMFMSTPFSREAADRLMRVGVPAFKIGSGETNSLPLIEHIGRLGLPVILSTGMNDLGSVGESVAVLKRLRVPLALMHCTSMYPAPFEAIRLGAIAEMRRAFEVPVGLSDHSPGVFASLGAVALGANLIEKHFTIDRTWPGPDNPMSIEPEELSELVEGARAIHAASGGSKTVLPEEQPVIDFAYSSIVAIAPIASGDVFTDKNIWVKRPGDGPLHARRFDEVVGKRAARELAENAQLSAQDVVGLDG